MIPLNWDAREYIFPIFELHPGEKDPISGLERSTYRGTGFFVGPKGLAITAAHVLKGIDEGTTNRVLVAVVVVDGKERLCRINKAAPLLSFDVALCSVTIDGSNFLPISTNVVNPGDDVTSIGIPTHRVHGPHLELRVLKGYVTGVYGRLELSFPVPAGMSGAPLFMGQHVVGYATGRVRSETIEEQTEEIIKVTNDKEEIRLTSTSSIVYYGLGYGFSTLEAVRDDQFASGSMLDWISAQGGQVKRRE
jgi:hypothetical protein